MVTEEKKWGIYSKHLKITHHHFQAVPNITNICPSFNRRSTMYGNMLSKAGSKYHVWIANRNNNPSTRWNHSQKLKIGVCAHHPLYTMFYEKSEKSQDIILYGS